MIRAAEVTQPIYFCHTMYCMSNKSSQKIVFSVDVADVLVLFSNTGLSQILDCLFMMYKMLLKTLYWHLFQLRYFHCTEICWKKGSLDYSNVLHITKTVFFSITVHWKVLWRSQNGYFMSSLRKHPFGTIFNSIDCAKPALSGKHVE